MKKLTGISLFIFAFSTFFVAPTFAQTPSFPLCTNPQGSVIANYDTGFHAIAGQMSLVEGRDTVYALNGAMNQVTQCYCPPTELNGIQTNWIQASTISEEEKQQLLASGWLYIQNGTIWGLANTPYLAQNVTYSCNETGNATPPQTTTTTITAVVQSADTTNNNNSNSSSNTGSSSNNNNSTSSTVSPSSLPSTGDSIILFEIVGLGMTSLTISYFLKKISA